MKNQKLISRNVIKRFAKGDIIKVNNLFYMDNGNEGVIPVYELRVPGSSTSTIFKGKTYYYTPSNNSFTPNPEIQKALNLNNISKVNETANTVLSLTNLHNTTRRLFNRNLSTTRSNSNRNLSRNLLTPTSSNRTNTNVEPWGMDLIFNSPLQFLTNVSLTSQDILRVLPLRVQTSNVNNENIPMWGMDLIFTSPLLRILLSTNSLPQQLEVQLLLHHRPFFEEYPYYTELEVQQNNKQKSKKKTSQTTTSSSTQEPKLFTIKEKDSESKFNRKNMEDELVFMNLLTKDEAKNKSDEEIVSLFLDYVNKNVSLLDKEPSKLEEKKELEVTTPVRTIPYNRADIRSLIRNGGYNPYSDYSAGLRKRLRKYLNKEDNQLYEEWMAPFVIFKKKGGKLISKNTITRFKNKI